MNHIILMGLLSASMVAPLPRAQADTSLTGIRMFRVRLTAPVSSDSTPGSRVAAQVVSPAAFAGDIIEGEIVKAKSSGHIDKKSVLVFTFSKLHHETSTFEIYGEIKRAYNSKGQENVDEQGYIVNQGGKGFLGKLPKTLPARIPMPRGLFGRKKEQIETTIKIAALVVAYTVKAPKISFDTGSEFEIEVIQR